MRHHYVMTIRFDKKIRWRTGCAYYTQNGYVEVPEGSHDLEIFESLCQQTCDAVGAHYPTTTVLYYRLAPDQC